MSAASPLFPAGAEPPMMVMCAWCSDVISLGREPVTHGCCEACTKAEMAKLGELRAADRVLLEVVR